MYHRQKRLQNNSASAPPVKQKQDNLGLFDDPEKVFEGELRKHEKRVRTDAGTGSWETLRGKLFVSIPFLDTDPPMTTSFLLKMLASIRIASAFYSVINDCDEIYNYWEPLHLLLFGRGFQTWEYSPEYAIRSWLYIIFHYIPAYFLSFITADSKVALFYTFRILLGFFHAGAEFHLYNSVGQRLGYGIARQYFIINLLAVGTFYSGSAFLPSSFSMIMNMFSMAFWLREKWFLAILCTAVSALVGWPFAAVLGLPIVVEMLLIRRGEYIFKFFKSAIASGIIVLAILYTVDSHYYGKTVIAPLNIVLYNVFSKHGPELYGVEPFTYYIKNLILNWNIAPFLALLAVPLSLITYIQTSCTYDSKDNKVTAQVVRPTNSIAYWYRFIPVALIALTAFVWAFIFFSQPHKEERFLFPIYPHIALLMAITLSSIRHFIPRKLNFFPYLLVALFALISISRGFAVFKHYRGIAETHKQLHDYLVFHPDVHFSEMNNPIQVCTGKEWHRFPSNFFIPEKATDKYGVTKKIELQFIRSAFRGLLPKPYANGSLPNITRLIPTEMNELNQEEPSRYIPIERCDYLIDFDDGTNGNSDEPNFVEMTDKYKKVYTHPVIIPDKSHWLYRAFYVPFISEKHVAYGNYAALQKIIH
jgi:alpha-1,2-mannosyltransferase